MKNYEKLLSVGLIALWVGMSIASVGQPTTGDSTYGWSLPFTMLFFLATPAIFAYMAGKKDGRLQLTLKVQS